METPDTVALPEGVSFLDLLSPTGFPLALATLLATWFAGRVLAELDERLGGRFVDRRLLIQQTGTVARFGVYLVGITVAVSFAIRLTHEVVLGLTGTVALTVGFAVKDLAASVVAGIIILVDRPFQVGDRVRFDDFYGEITSIGLRSVRLLTLENVVVTIPNNKFLTDAVSSGNAGELDMLCQIDFLVGMDQDVGRAKAIVAEAITGCRFAYLQKPWQVWVSQTTVGNAPAFRLRAEVNVFDVVYEKELASDVTERVWEGFRAAGVQPPAVLVRSLDGDGTTRLSVA